MVKGFILIKLVPGFESSAVSAIRTIPGVSEVNLVFGQWDAIVVAEAKSLFQLSKVVISDVRCPRYYDTCSRRILTSIDSLGQLRFMIV